MFIGYSFRPRIAVLGRIPDTTPTGTSKTSQAYSLPPVSWSSAVADSSSSATPTAWRAPFATSSRAPTRCRTPWCSTWSPGTASASRSRTPSTVYLLPGALSAIVAKIPTEDAFTASFAIGAGAGLLVVLVALFGLPRSRGRAVAAHRVAAPETAVETPA
ncbi:hypothetical protein GCM10023205_78360 [Yinghuangia aomiensis]|uniref:Uncharacterized protein n=1 Tax=Yinghuangia aomiensis TaxID=676205 RepID=A0ABP9ICE4_9ACTN